MRRITLLGIAISILLGIACEDAISPEPGLDYTADSPIKCIISLEYALNAREAALYDAMFSPDFAFYFEPDIVGEEVNGYTIPKSWGYDEEERVIRNMVRPYEEGGAYSIFIRIPDGDIGDPPDGADTYTAEDVRFKMEIMYDEEEGFDTYFWDAHEFTFERITRDGISFWRLTEWKDISSWFDHSLSYVKAYYYSLDPLPE